MGVYVCVCVRKWDVRKCEMYQYALKCLRKTYTCLLRDKLNGSVLYVSERLRKFILNKDENGTD
uniref:Uncharacterized protein n=1 Tax=Setaria digitata TaxID=48799 RepID=A0A915Q0U3_9BILA